MVHGDTSPSTRRTNCSFGWCTRSSPHPRILATPHLSVWYSSPRPRQPLGLEPSQGAGAPQRKATFLHCLRLRHRASDSTPAGTSIGASCTLVHYSYTSHTRREASSSLVRADCGRGLPVERWSQAWVSRSRGFDTPRARVIHFFFLLFFTRIHSGAQCGNLWSVI